MKEITWLDSSLQNTQVDKTDFPKPTIIKSLGYVVEDNKEYIVLARDDMGEGDYRGLVAIPKFAIIKEDKNV